MSYGIGVKTTTPSAAFTGQSVNDIRRTFGISDKVAQLAPAESIFFSYLSRLGKKSTDETVWKPFEYRNQWQRRNFKATQVYLSGGTAEANAVWADADNSNDGTHVAFECDYNYQGKKLQSYTHLGTSATGGYSPIFLVAGQILRIGGVVYKLTAAPTYYDEDDGATNWDVVTAPGKNRGGVATIPLANLVVVSTGSAIAAHTTGAETTDDGQVIGSQWAEGSGAPEGWRDEMSDTEFFTQIFKTSVPLMTGSSMATRYRGFANEWKRIYAEHIKSHKMDLEHAFLFGYGQYGALGSAGTEGRTSWGMIPFLENMGGKKYELAYNGTAADSAGYDVSAGFTYDGITDVMDEFMNYEGGNSGQKLCLTSRKVINHLNKMNGGFVDNSLGSNSKELFNASLNVKKSSFMPIDISSVTTSWGGLNFVAHPFFRGDMADKAVCIDLSNVALRPLSGNGISRDTFVETNIQDNDIDGRKDQIITEAGLEILLPETHAVIDFVAGG